ncbi:hypothetical protein [Flavobacterium sp. N2270]|uniref:hypothetical protein n=1 Tax=Flavobacterium sp. N2270 TaxID=2986831 RepID=UPI002224C1E1|nr:hypothetical protein [Flavobacterium sp. N2270]
MKKVYFKILVVLLICNFSFSQTKTNFTLENFKINLTESPASTSYIDTYANLKWDAGLMNKETSLSKIYLEIVPIMDCWNNVNATDLKKTIFIDLKNESVKKVNNHMITHKNLASKCFKWRIRFVGKQGNQMTSWNYHLFIK